MNELELEYKKNIRYVMQIGKQLPVLGEMVNISLTITKDMNEEQMQKEVNTAFDLLKERTALNNKKANPDNTEE